jgi:hypothetical protein
MRGFWAVIAAMAMAAALSGCLSFVVNREVEEHHYHSEPSESGESTTRVVTVEESTSFELGNPQEVFDQL